MNAATWTTYENQLIVADYFVMLAAEVAGQEFNKSAHRRALLPRLNNRTEGSIEFKHQNISAVLKCLGEDWIKGYKPAFNFQSSLVGAVSSHLILDKAWLERLPTSKSEQVLEEASSLWIGPAPALLNRPEPIELEQSLAIARKFDVAARDERNHILGRAGEKRVLAYEKENLKTSGRPDLAERVRWISEEEGDGAGFDIQSFEPDGSDRLIEVKTTNGWERTPFYISRNELAKSEQLKKEWCLLRLYNFNRDARAFQIRPPLESQVSLIANSFEARFS